MKNKTPETSGGSSAEKEVAKLLAREKFSAPMNEGEDYTLRVVDSDYVLTFPEDEVKGRAFHFTMIGGIYGTYAQIRDTIAEFAAKKSRRGSQS